MEFSINKSSLRIHTKLYTSTIVLLLFLTSTAAANKPKRTLKNNMTISYNLLPETASSFAEMFTKGEYYARLRMNYFDFEHLNNDLHDPTGFGLGGSLIIKSAPFYGISTTIGVYTSQNLGIPNKNDSYKCGKDTFSRYNVFKNGDWGMNVLAQAYLQYHFLKTDIKIGRQIFESFLTKSNDTKMIPNTFEGCTLVSRDIPDTTIKLAFLSAQKLRDHTRFHDVITYGTKHTDYVGLININNWKNNDDSAVHKGLTYNNLRNNNKDADNHLVIVGVTNKSIKNLQLDLWYNGVPDLFYSLMTESNYKIALPNGWSLTPGLRFMKQIDRGAGRIGGASISGTLACDKTPLAGDGGYTNPDSVDGKLYAARLVLRKNAGMLLAGYSKITDEADLISPWRSFSTGGYTRSMAQYNWYANNASWMVKAGYDFGKAGIIKGFRACIDYVYMDYDDKKVHLGGNAKTDRYIIHTDMWYLIPFLSDLEAKLRLAYVDAQRTWLGINPSYAEFRFELNYLF